MTRLNFLKNRRISVVALVLTLVALPGALLASNSSRTGADLSNKVRHELVMLPYLTIFDNLAYRVDGPNVTLSGEVCNPTLKGDAERIVRRIPGVETVTNKIEVLPLSPMDNQIRRATARAIYGYPALQRYGMGTLPPIRIIVDNGNVTLVGVVANEMDRNLAYMRANGVSGVFSVTNNLLVEQPGQS